MLVDLDEDCDDDEGRSPSASDLPGLVPHLLQQRVVLDYHSVLNVRALDKIY